MSWPDMMSPWNAGPPPADPLRTTILGGLAYAALDLRERTAGDCADCGDGPCPDHAEAASLAGQFENAYMQVANGSTAWCDLAVKLISEMNLRDRNGHRDPPAPGRRHTRQTRLRP